MVWKRHFSSLTNSLPVRETARVQNRKSLNLVVLVDLENSTSNRGPISSIASSRSLPLSPRESLPLSLYRSLTLLLSPSVSISRPRSMTMLLYHSRSLFRVALPTLPIFLNQSRSHFLVALPHDRQCCHRISVPCSPVSFLRRSMR